MSTAIPHPRTRAHIAARLSREWLWIAGGGLMAFAIPFVWSTAPRVPRDVFYALYGLSLGVFLFAYLRDTRLPLRATLLRHWRSGVALGLVGAGAMAVVAYRSSAGSAHAFHDRPLLARVRGKLAVGALALAISVCFTAVYRLGYPDFRSSKLTKPVSGDLVWSAPTLLTLNPAGAPIAHIGLHVTAVVHDYDTGLFLPPHAG